MGDIAEHLRATVAAAAATRRPLRLHGGDSKRFYGNPLQGRPLDLSGHRGIVSHEPTELVLTARAGTPLGKIEALLAEHGLHCGAIVRTVAEGAGREALEADLKYLVKLWSVVQERCSNAAVKSLIHEDLSLPLRVLRDLVTSDVERILVDSKEEFDAMRERLLGE